MHLALKELGVGPGDEVIGSTLTFVGSISPVIFLGATLVMLDCDRTSWNMDPALLSQALESAKQRGKLPKAVVPTDLYGQCADYQRIFEICDAYDVPVVVDAAEAMGARYRFTGDQGKQSGDKSGIPTNQWVHAGVGARQRFFPLMATRS